MNKDLYGKSYELPENILNHLDKSFAKRKGANDSHEGYRRNKDLRNKKSITYQGLKRVKNWFDNFNGNPNDLSYTLNGGDTMKNWVNQTLSGDRNSIYSSKKNKSDTGMENQFISPHQKNGIDDLNRPSQSHSSFNDDIKVTESLKRINELIQKII